VSWSVLGISTTTAGFLSCKLTKSRCQTVSEKPMELHQSLSVLLVRSECFGAAGENPMFVVQARKQLDTGGTADPKL
jgi:hypothetical protein